MKKGKKNMTGILISVGIILLLLIIIFPPSRGKLPDPADPKGIAERIDLDVDGGRLSLMLISKDTGNPVLIVCGGGPGIPQYLLEYMYSSPLPEVFTVCYWDYRGTGASYDPNIIPEEMTTERYIKDTLAVTDYLSKRFRQDRIYIMGHSFGTYIALKTVQAHPEKYVCYIAMSQICDQTESEYIAFDYMENEYRKSGNDRMVKEFEKYNIRTSAQDYRSYFFSGLRDKAMHDLGVGTARNMRSVITGIFFPSLRCTAYTQAERINLWKGKSMSAKFPVTEDAISDFNAFEDVPKLDIPVYFLVGAYDYTCCASLQQQYYENVEAPLKSIYIFTNSAHSPLYEDHEKGKTVLTEIIGSISVPSPQTGR